MEKTPTRLKFSNSNRSGSRNPSPSPRAHAITHMSTFDEDHAFKNHHEGHEATKKVALGYSLGWLVSKKNRTRLSKQKFFSMLPHPCLRVLRGDP